MSLSFTLPYSVNVLKARAWSSSQLSRRQISANRILWSKNIFIISSQKLPLFWTETGYLCCLALSCYVHYKPLEPLPSRTLLDTNQTYYPCSSMKVHGESSSFIICWTTQQWLPISSMSRVGLLWVDIVSLLFFLSESIPLSSTACWLFYHVTSWVQWRHTLIFTEWEIIMSICNPDLWWCENDLS